MSNFAYLQNNKKRTSLIKNPYKPHFMKIQSDPSVSTKAIFAAFLNMARNNLFIILNHIQHQIGETSQIGEGQLHEARLWAILESGDRNKVEKEKQYAALRQLNRHFPFLSDNQLGQETRDFFVSFLERLNEERNYHTHYFYASEERSSITGLENIKSKAKEFLLQKIEDGIERQAAIAQKVEEGEEITDQRYRGFDQAELSMLKELDFSIFKDGSSAFTEVGLAFFITLFLEKKYAAQFLSKVPYLQALSEKDEREARLLKEWLWFMSCRLPQPKLESSDILMDILNELHRAPAPLFNRLSQADKKKFEVDFHSEDEDLMLAMGNQKNILKRKEDRFPYLAMRAMDELKLFDRLRFHIHLGKWLRKSGHASRIIEDRKIYEELRSFGRLNYYTEENAPDDWKRSAEDEEGLEPTWYRSDIEQFAPQYRITGNRIGVKYQRDSSAATWRSLSEYEPNQESDQKARKTKAKHFKPDAILSTYELGPLFLYQYLHKFEKDEDGKPVIPKDAETFLADYNRRFQKFCEDVKDDLVQPVGRETFQKKIRRPFEKATDKNTYNDDESNDLEKRKVALQEILDQDKYRLQVKDLPDPLKEYLLNYDHDPAETLKLKLIQRKKETEQIHKDFRRAIDRLILGEKKIPDHLNNETLAEELVDDILRWRPVNNKKQKFAKKDKEILLRLLSQYPHNKLALEEHIKWSKGNRKSMQLIDKKYDYAHPFLDKAAPFKHKDIRSFYLQYLEENQKWLQKMLQPAGKNEPKPDQYFRKQNKVDFQSALAAVSEKYENLKEEVEQLDQEIGHTDQILNGDLATYLIRDFFYLKPRNNREDAKNFGMPNSQEYQRLHAALALYSSDIDGLVQLMEELGLMGEQAKNPHPFLHKTNPQVQPGIKAFYEIYLLEKIDWLNQIINNLGEVKRKISKNKKVGKKDLLLAEETLDLFGSRQLWKKKKARHKGVLKAIQAYLEHQPKGAKDYSQSPIFLPRGLFNEAINSALRKRPDLDIEPEDNFSRCLAKFVGEETQPFYHWPRIYQFEDLEENITWNNNVDSWNKDLEGIKKQVDSLNLRKEKDKENRLPEEQYLHLQRLKRLSRNAKGNEQTIRYFQTMDRILIMAIRKLAETKQPNDGFWIEGHKLNLNNIYPEALKKVKGEEASGLLNEPILMKIEVAGKIILDRLPIKRYGEFRKFFKDRRLEGLLQYFDEELIDQELLKEIGVVGDSENSIPRQQLMKELEDYDAGRDIVFQDVLELEKAISEGRKTQFQVELNQQTHLDHYRHLCIIDDKLSTELKDILSNYRNKFGHNQVFYSEFLKGKADQIEKNIMRPIMSHMNRTYYWLISNLPEGE